MNKFASLCGLVKSVKRAGWLRYLPAEHVESVGDHSAKITFLTFALRGVENVDYQKCMEMAIMHDIAEGIVGDYTPYDKITYSPARLMQEVREACQRTRGRKTDFRTFG